MKKKLLSIGLLTIGYAAQAQVLLHVDDTATMYVSEGTLVYNGGGLQTRGSGVIDLHGNMMVVGASTDVLKTITTTNVDKTNGNNVILRMNDPNNISGSTYGQLYVSGIPQNSILGYISKEFKNLTHGAPAGSYFQQIAMPFSGKVLNTLSTEFGKTFGTTRFTQNEILKFNNSLVVSDHYTNLNSATSDPTGYYMLGSKNGNLNTAMPPASLGNVYVINGKPYSDITSQTNAVALSGAGNGINFGAGGNAINQYLEKYNTYLQDNLESTTSAWSGTYGKNLYQYGNPFLTNIDLSRIGYIESATAITDGNNVSNIWGVRYDPGVVTTLSNGSTYSTGAKMQTFNNTAPNIGVPVGDVGLVIKPMQAFVIKLRNNTPQTLNFNTLRRFNSTVRAAGTDYGVTANKLNNNTAKNSNTIKQLGVIAIDAAGNEIGRTYYVVSASGITGHQSTIDTSIQAGNSSSNILGSFEEALNGGYDLNYTAAYWLYINEANENDFLGKNVKLANYDYGVNNKAVSYKFEIRENAELVPTGTHLLSKGIGFYYKATNGTLLPAVQGEIIPITNAEADLYYGAPNNVVLATGEIKKPSRTMVAYNPEISDYIVRFDPNWKKANIQVYDMSGKLIISQKDVNTKNDFIIRLDGAVKSSYVVKIVSDNGEIVNTKVIK